MELPAVVFGFNRPDKLRRILEALRPQHPDRLVIFIDGPRTDQDRPRVEACRSLARQVNWAPTDLHLWEGNRGLTGLTDNLTLAFETYPWAVIVEDDCLPMPGFYAFMRRGLERYQHERQVFSLGGYQRLPPSFFADSKEALVSSARFNCWGWATWSDRWQKLLPDIRGYASLFDGLQDAPHIAGADLPEMARRMAAGELPESWDVNVSIATLYRRQVHLVCTRGLVRNIGLDRSGFHGGFAAAVRDRFMQNRNVVAEMPPDLTLPEQVAIDPAYAAALSTFAALTQVYTPRRLAQRGRTLARRYFWPGMERRAQLDLRPFSGESGNPLPKRALLSYIIHPFSIPPGDPRFLRHINIFHAHEMVRALNALGYAVDVIDYRDSHFSPQKNYDLFIGHGGINFNRIADRLPATTPCLYLSTTSYWKFHNQQEQERFSGLNRRRQADLPLDRNIEAPEEAALRRADGIVGIGNAATRATYADFARVIMIDGTTLRDDLLDWRPKDIAAGQNGFLYYASGGNVHKGLDITLEAFVGLAQHLWVMAPLDAGFKALFQRELFATPNIHTLGWVQPRSPDYYRAMAACNFCILPSCSEGQSQSVIDAMNQGLVPVVSRAAGVDGEDYGFIIDPVSVESVRAMVQRLAGLSLARQAELSRKARQAAQTRYAPQRFSLAFQTAVQTLLKDWPPEATSETLAGGGPALHAPYSAQKE